MEDVLKIAITGLIVMALSFLVIRIDYTPVNGVRSPSAVSTIATVVFLIGTLSVVASLLVAIWGS